jgi:DNA-binding MarR family transcriptional regulator
MASDSETVTFTRSRTEKAGLVTPWQHEAERRAHRAKLQPEGWRAFEKARRMAMHLQVQGVGGKHEHEAHYTQSWTWSTPISGASARRGLATALFEAQPNCGGQVATVNVLDDWPSVDESSGEQAREEVRATQAALAEAGR